MGLRQLLTPSFRARLRLFFVVIVVVPMITMAVVLYQLIVASESSQTDARLSTSQTVSNGIHDEEQVEAGQVAEQIGSDQQLADALDAGDRRAVQSRLDRLAERNGTRYVNVRVNGKGEFEAGSLPAMAAATRRIVNDQRQPTGEITVAMLAYHSADGLAGRDRRRRRAAGQHAARREL
jgi:hypothetical protein